MDADSHQRLRRFCRRLGGVDVCDPQYNIDEYDGNPPEYHHMQGHEALWYVRKREGTSDIDRNRRQQEMIRLMRKILGSNLVHLPAWYAKYNESFRSNLNLIDLFNFIPLALNLEIPKDCNLTKLAGTRLPPGAHPVVQLSCCQSVKPFCGNFKSYVLCVSPTTLQRLSKHPRSPIDAIADPDWYAHQHTHTLPRLPQRPPQATLCQKDDQPLLHQLLHPNPSRTDIHPEITQTSTSLESETQEP